MYVSLVSDHGKNLYGDNIHSYMDLSKIKYVLSSSVQKYMLLQHLYAFLKYYAEYESVDIEKAFEAVPETSQLVVMAVAMAPLAIGGFVLTILLIKAIARMNGRTITMASICGNKEEIKDMKPVNVCLILGWIFCLIICISNLFAA